MKNAAESAFQPCVDQPAIDGGGPLVDSVRAQGTNWNVERLAQR